MQPLLTAKQRRLLAYLETEILRTGKAPSLRQAAAEQGVSHAAVAQLLKALEDKGYIKREGRYSRTIHVLNQARQAAGVHRWQEIPIIGHVTAGLPMYAQQQWDGALVVDGALFRGANLFALRIQGNSMKNAGILNGDIAICEPRQFAQNGQIVVALINNEEATVKRFFLFPDYVELRPENPAYSPVQYAFDNILIQGLVTGIHRGPDVMERL